MHIKFRLEQLNYTNSSFLSCKCEEQTAYLHFLLDQSVFADQYKNMRREAAADHRTGNC